MKIAEYIEREAVMKTAKNGNHSDFGRCMADLTSLREVLEDTLTADVVEFRHGEWIYDHWCEFKCSECGEYSNSKPIKGKEKFCPNCGAKMDGKDGDEND